MALVAGSGGGNSYSPAGPDLTWLRKHPVTKTAPAASVSALDKGIEQRYGPDPSGGVNYYRSFSTGEQFGPPVPPGLAATAPQTNALGNWLGYGPLRDYHVGGAPQMNTNAAGYGSMPNFRAPQIASIPNYDPVSGSAMMLDYGLGNVAGNFRVNADAAVNRIGEVGGQRVSAAAEDQISRGMGRSGNAILAEDAVRRQVGIDQASALEEAANQTAGYNLQAGIASAGNRTNLGMANQRADIDFKTLQDEGARFKANMDLSRQLANQEATIKALGLETQFKGQLADIQARKAIANQDAMTAYENIRAGNEQFYAGLLDKRTEGNRNYQLGRYGAENTAAYQRGQLQNETRGQDLQYPQGGMGMTAYQQAQLDYNREKDTRDANMAFYLRGNPVDPGAMGYLPPKMLNGGKLPSSGPGSTLAGYSPEQLYNGMFFRQYGRYPTTAELRAYAASGSQG